MNEAYEGFLIGKGVVKPTTLTNEDIVQLRAELEEAKRKESLKKHDHA